MQWPGSRFVFGSRKPHFRVKLRDVFTEMGSDQEVTYPLIYGKLEFIQQTLRK
jgi:hypothetical protein